MSENPPERTESANGSDRHETHTDEAVDCQFDVHDFSMLVGDCAVATFDTDGTVSAWNDGARRLTGYDDETVVGSHYRRFFPAAARESGRPERVLERARTAGSVENKAWRVRADGRQFFAREVIVPIREDGTIGDEGGLEIDDMGGYVWFVQDRTEGHERERKLSEEKAFVESVFEAQPDVVYAFDSDENYLEWNDRVPAVTGYTEAELADMNPVEFIAPEDRERIRNVIQRVLEEDEYVTAEANLLTKDGRRIPYEFNSARITGDDGAVLGFTGVGRNVRERKAREQALREEKAFTESVLEAQPDVLYAYDTEGNLIQWNDQFERETGYTPAEFADVNPLTFIAPEDRDRIEDAIDRILEEGERVTAEGRVLTSDGDRIHYEFNSARITDDDGTVLGFTGVARDISDRKARERELERLERLNAIVRTIDETMVTADTRDEIESAIVEGFAAADPYRFAVIGRTDPASPVDRQSVGPVSWAGVDESTVEDVFTSFVEPPAEANAASPIETRTVQRYRNLRESPVDQWRATAREHGCDSVAVVPIVATDRTFGAIVVAAAEADAFADREREVLQEFGGTIGHAINAMVVRQLLYMDTIDELEFESTDRGDTCIRLSEDLGCELSLDHLLPLTDEVFVYYLTVTGADPERIREGVDDDDAVSEYRLVDATDDESYWEIVVRGSAIAELLTEYGARLQSKVVRDGVGKLTVQASRDANLRELVDGITSAYPETELVSKRTVDRPVETRGDFRHTVESLLTEKQRFALEAAYHGGYFEWPARNSDASEVADRLEIARQTFHQHLRVALEKLLSAYFGTDD
ncbi:PAS domain S-box protein [Natrinema caseinilyticum]|uniref:PAS domain S-box protein n=1 Tax=Natrinema caseinilyticum TaxID=2961570 RepID=UPI0020C3C5AA|nr:PAS domain S-box protein [Natrinema caseinilyticum]